MLFEESKREDLKHKRGIMTRQSSVFNPIGNLTQGYTHHHQSKDRHRPHAHSFDCSSHHHLEYLDDQRVVAESWRWICVRSVVYAERYYGTILRYVPLAGDVECNVSMVPTYLGTICSIGEALLTFHL